MFKPGDLSPSLTSRLGSLAVAGYEIRTLAEPIGLPMIGQASWDKTKIGRYLLVSPSGRVLASDTKLKHVLADAVDIAAKLEALRVPQARWARRKNPIDEDVFARFRPYPFPAWYGAASQEAWSFYAMRPAWLAAEMKLGVRLSGEVYGCGDYGCAAPTDDGRVLKLTVDTAEVEWAKLAHRYGLPGMVQVFNAPVVVGKNCSADDGRDTRTGNTMISSDYEWHRDIYAYLREAAVDVPKSLWEQISEEQLLSTDASRSVAALAQHGFDVTDWESRQNMGIDASGELVIRDARALPIRHSRPGVLQKRQ
jgi:hypothetical protein